MHLPPYDESPPPPYEPPLDAVSTQPHYEQSAVTNTISSITHYEPHHEAASTSSHTAHITAHHQHHETETSSNSALATGSYHNETDIAQPNDKSCGAESSVMGEVVNQADYVESSEDIIEELGGGVVRARALWDFTGQMPCDLSFTQGMLVVMIYFLRL